MSRTQGSGIPRWVTAVNVAVILATLALVIPSQVGASHLPAPTGLCVCFRPSQTAPKLTWGGASGQVIQGYILQRSRTVDFTSNVVEIRIAKNTFAHIDETRAFNTVFWYRIASYVGTDRSPYSNVVRAVNGPGTAPSAPAAPDNVIVSQEGNALRIRWRNNANNETGIWVERSGDEQVTWEYRASLSIDSTSYLDTDPPPGAPFYRIWAFNSGGLAASYAVQYVNAGVNVPGVPSIPGIPSIGIPSIGIPSIGVPSIGIPSIPNLQSATALASIVTGLASGVASNATNLASATAVASATNTASALQSQILAIPGRIQVWIGLRQWSDKSYLFTWQAFFPCFPGIGPQAPCPEPRGVTWLPVPGSSPPIYEYAIYTDFDATS